LVKNCVAQTQPNTWFSIVKRARVFHSGSRCDAENLQLSISCRLLFSGVVYLFEHAWHRKNKGGLEGAHVFNEVFGVGSVPNDRSGGEYQYANEAGEYVSQRHEEQRARTGRAYFITQFS